ncbi:MAG: hypothetical protein A3D31_03865 [Candidatus Fluviicola riflensis]|nr:MAG: hypothetical protein CHH17_11165 [Candidatus Fluviicola riflensis]OGS79115.1 MAG: hypothetical protein A3D31_03865 [Candidatus Fluviicola riflensis]OGS86547.1 MAG: hypothetical protein A2724_03325 [Fluviicola sp. RIFCSPHIGHO2_01_FULL_43_53]OGS88978.1 MAG: hypothetical protein A3E30_01335 [Fluviicola sp. RIFCSPHIGHO2_12_FULL_43_24]
MRKHVLTCCSIFVLIAANAQEVVSTQGDSYSNASGNIDFTIGEVVINTASNGSNDLTQGFHQTNWNFLGTEDHDPAYEVTIFPNPTQDQLNIRTNSFENVICSFYDAEGKLVLQSNLTAEQTSIPVSQLATGSYSLILNNGTQNIKTIKLIKTH